MPADPRAGGRQAAHTGSTDTAAGHDFRRRKTVLFGGARPSYQRHRDGDQVPGSLPGSAAKVLALFALKVLNLHLSNFGRCRSAKVGRKITLNSSEIRQGPVRPRLLRAGRCENAPQRFSTDDDAKGQSRSQESLDPLIHGPGDFCVSTGAQMYHVGKMLTEIIHLFPIGFLFNYWGERSFGA